MSTRCAICVVSVAVTIQHALGVMANLVQVRYTCTVESLSIKIDLLKTTLGLKLDVCGVCGGDGTSCLSGCDNRPFSNATVDLCGVCGGDGQSCLSGCDRKPYSDKKLDQCGVHA